MYKTLI